jgi:tetratricopeptide (TPR) repeat protein
LQREAVAAVERTLAINPKSGAAHLALYWLEPTSGRWFERQKLLEQAVADSIPGNPAWSIQTTFLAQVGRFTDALECARQGHMRDRADHGAGNIYGWILVRAGKFREARPLLEEVLARWPDAYYAAVNLILACAFEEDWKTLDLLIAPERLAKFPLRELTPILGYVALLRDPSPESRRRPIASVRSRFELTGHADIQQWVAAAHLAGQFGSIDEAYEIAEKADFGPVGDAGDRLGTAFDRGAALFFQPYSAVRRDRRFVKLCARLGLVEFWMKTGLWPDCVEEVAPYYDFKAECEKSAAEPKA